MTDNQLMRGKYVVIDLQAQSQQVATQVDQLNGLAGDAGRVINVILQNGRDQQGNPLPYDLTGKTVALCAKDAQGKVKISRMMTRENDPMGMFSLEIPAPFYQAEGRIQDGYIGVFNSDDLNLVIGSMPITFEVRHNSLLVGTGDGISQAFDSQYNALTAKVNGFDDRIADTNRRIANNSSAVDAYTKLINDKQVVLRQDQAQYDSRISANTKAIDDTNKKFDPKINDLWGAVNPLKDRISANAQAITDTNNKFDPKINDLWGVVNPTKDSVAVAHDRLNSDNTRINKLASDNTAWTDWAHEGTSMCNGGTRYGDASTDVFYRTRFIGGRRQVHLRFTLKGVWKAHNQYVSLPSFLRASWSQNFAQPCRDNDSALWIVKDQAVTLHANTAGQYNNADWYTFSAVYEAEV